MRVSIIVAALAPIVAVSAQSTTETSDSVSAPAATPSGVTTCVTDCSGTAATAAGCTSFTNLPCVCTNPAFQQAATTCLQTNCPDQLQAAVGLQQSLCAPYVSGSSAIASASSSIAGVASSLASSIHSAASATASHASQSAASAASASATHTGSAASPVAIPGSMFGIASFIVAALVGPVVLFA
ncbi:hypothetical protein FRB99_006943 [Tulasnella sp. 403]|nr:hypothetical protein FRB99_006943 [Tulasnella sp. 403]